MNKKEIKLNKFEIARLISARALEIAEGDKTIDTKEAKFTHDYVKIAKKELETDTLPIEIYKN